MRKAVRLKYKESVRKYDSSRTHLTEKEQSFTILPVFCDWQGGARDFAEKIFDQ